MNRTSCLVVAFGALAVLAATQSCSSQDLATGRTAQAADGCGAFRYRGSANVDCRYEGRIEYGSNHSGTCLSDSQVECTFDARCEWALYQRITECVSDAPDCMSVYPPEGSTVNPSSQTFTLSPGDTLCDPPGTAAELRTYCTNRFWDVFGGLRDACNAQSDRNTGGTTCCLNCAKPIPLPENAGLDGEEFGGDTYCSGEDN